MAGTIRTVDSAFRRIGTSLWVHASPCRELSQTCDRVFSSSGTTSSSPEHSTQSTTTMLSATHVFTQPDVDAFCQLTDDTNPIHRGTHAIVPGILSASLFPSLISRHFPGSIYASQTLTFRQPILVDESLEVTLTSRGERHGLVQFQCAIRKKQQGHEPRGLAVDGTALVKLP